MGRMTGGRQLMTATTMLRPRGRRPGNDDTRGTIRAAASRLFESEGYERVSLRGIAREADVDPALVHHYFDSKADLFCQAVLATDQDIDARVHALVTGDRAEVGLRVVRVFFDAWDDSARRTGYAFGPQAVIPVSLTERALTEFAAREVFAPVAARFGHANAVLRGQLTASVLLGITVSRHVIQTPTMASATARALTAPLAATVQHYLVDAW